MSRTPHQDREPERGSPPDPEWRHEWFRGQNGEERYRRLTMALARLVLERIRAEERAREES